MISSIRIFLAALCFGAAGAGLLAQPAAEEQGNPRTQPAGEAAAAVVADADGRPARPGDPRFPDAPPGATITDQGWFEPVDRPTPPKLPKRIFVIPVRGEITEGLYLAMRRKVMYARSQNAEMIVLDMDTPGGRVDAAMRICQLLKTETEDVFSVCLVRPHAFSAGAMIAVACDQIVMTPNGLIGDCAPIAMGGEKLEGVRREKIETAIRAVFRDSAQSHGYNVPLSMSMVTHDLEVWLVRNVHTRELRYVLKRDWQDQVVGRGARAGGGDGDDLFGQAPQWELLKVAVPAKELLTMTAPEARQFGFAAAVLDAPAETPYRELLRFYDAAGEPVTMPDTWSETLVGFLQSPLIRGILLFVGLACGYTELRVPGFGVFGVIAIACFAILFGSGYLSGMSQWWEIAAFLLGVALLLVEILVIPGFGVAGISGIILCVLSLLAMGVANAPDDWPVPSTPVAMSLFLDYLFWMCLGFAAAVVAIILLANSMQHIPMANRLVLSPAGPQASADTSPRSHLHVGDVGIVEAPLRPVGRARFGEDLIDVQSEGEAIPTGARVKVIAKDGSSVTVERAGGYA